MQFADFAFALKTQAAINYDALTLPTCNIIKRATSIIYNAMYRNFIYFKKG